MILSHWQDDQKTLRTAILQRKCHFLAAFCPLLVPPPTHMYSTGDTGVCVLYNILVHEFIQNGIDKVATGVRTFSNNPNPGVTMPCFYNLKLQIYPFLTQNAPDACTPLTANYQSKRAARSPQ